MTDHPQLPQELRRLRDFLLPAVRGLSQTNHVEMDILVGKDYLVLLGYNPATDGRHRRTFVRSDLEADTDLIKKFAALVGRGATPEAFKAQQDRLDQPMTFKPL